MRKRAYVLTGTFAEFKQWCTERNVRYGCPEVVYISNASSLMGIHFPADGTLYKYGTWKNRPDYADLFWRLDVWQSGDEESSGDSEQMRIDFIGCEDWRTYAV